MQSRRILVTGANGFIGHHLCKKLLEYHYEVVALAHSDSSPNLEALKNSKKLTIVQGDIRDHRFTTKLCRQYPVEVVFHLAIASPTQNAIAKRVYLPDAVSYQTNFEGTLNLLTATVQTGTTAWIQSSTMSVYNYESPDYVPLDEQHPTDPKDIYGFSKLLAEHACRFYANDKLNVIILRYSGVYGTGKQKGLIAQITKACLDNLNKQFSVAVDRTSDFIHVEDVIAANLLAMDRLLNSGRKNSEKGLDYPVKIYNIGSGEEISAYNAAKIIQRLCKNKSVEIEKVQEKSRRFTFDISAAQNELGFSPSSVEEGLTKYIRQMKK